MDDLSKSSQFSRYLQKNIFRDLRPRIINPAGVGSTKNSLISFTTPILICMQKCNLLQIISFLGVYFSWITTSPGSRIEYFIIKLTIFTTSRHLFQNSSAREDSRIFTKEDFENIFRERSSSYVVTAQDLIRPKEIIKPTTQSSSTSCINAIMNSGVGDILKKMVNKKRDNASSETPSSLARRSFSEKNSK